MPHHKFSEYILFQFLFGYPANETRYLAIETGYPANETSYPARNDKKLIRFGTTLSSPILVYLIYLYNVYHIRNDIDTKLATNNDFPSSGRGGTSSVHLFLLLMAISFWLGFFGTYVCRAKRGGGGGQS